MPLSFSLEPVLTPVAQLQAYSRNARTHSPSQVREIADSIQRFGWTNPVLVGEDGVILAGHGRLAAASLLKLDLIPAIVLHGLSEEERRAYILADNKIAMNASWDLEVLRVELTELNEADFDLDLTGFSATEVEEIFKQEGKGLAQRFGGFVPFTVFDAADDAWQAYDRQARKDLGLDKTTSPQAVHMMLRLFCPAGGAVATVDESDAIKASIVHAGYLARDEQADCLVDLWPKAEALALDLPRYQQAIFRACMKLREDAFACVLVDDVSTPDGIRDAIGETVKAFAIAGLFHHNEGVVLWPAPVRHALRGKMPRMHSALLVFCKGDPRKAAQCVGESYPQEARYE